MKKQRNKIEPPAHSTLTVSGTSDVWTIEENVDPLIVINGKTEDEDEDDAEELIVVDAANRRILCPPCYNMNDLGAAVWKAMDISRTEANR